MQYDHIKGYTSCWGGQQKKLKNRQIVNKQLLNDYQSEPVGRFFPLSNHHYLSHNRLIHKYLQGTQ